jgi:hypothetical protein
LDVFGRTLRVGDRVGVEFPDHPGRWWLAWVMSFDPLRVDPLTGRVFDGWKAVTVEFDQATTDHPKGAVVYPSWCRVSTVPDTVTPPCSSPARECPTAVGFVVGVLESGPVELQGRVGVVMHEAWTLTPEGEPFGTMAEAVYVLCDGNVGGWVSPYQLTPLPKVLTYAPSPQ